MHVIATAGHVDHGKSRLVQALTGMDPDRLDEEKRRGLTIDLGFAWLPLPSGEEVGIVDVPGHERFIRNMLAGVGAIDVTLFIVAANEGWKPQSQEHLDILHLLGVRSGIVVITKFDLVDTNQLEAVMNQVSKKLNRTTLEGSPIIPVSAVTGEGIQELMDAIEELLGKVPAAPDTGRPRLWIDRIFSMRGSGTVVTGTLNDGALAQQEEVAILPGRQRARVRTIQSHRKRIERIGPGNRTALNLVGVELEAIARGDVVTRPDRWLPTSKVLVELEFLPHLSHPPSEKGAFKFYVGSAERDASVRFLEIPLDTDAGHVPTVVSLDHPVVIDWGDRFVLRDSGRRETLGGGKVIEPHPSEGRAAQAQQAKRRAAIEGRTDYAQILIDEDGLITKDDLRLRSGLAPSEKDLEGVFTRTLIFSKENFGRLESQLHSLLEQHHAGHPLEPGLPRESGRTSIALDVTAFDELISELTRRGSIVGDETAIRLPTHTAAPPELESAELLETISGKASPPTVGELQKQFDPSLIRALVRSRRLIQVSADLVYPAEWIEELKASVREMLEESGSFTVSAFRDAVGTTRKYAVPLLEYLDQIGFTRRNGDERIAGPNL